MATGTSMRTSICVAVVFTILLLQLLGLLVSAEHVAVLGSGNDTRETRMGRRMRMTMMRRSRVDTVQVAGSSLPNCSHACGSCSPCRLVMVSFVCASLSEAETCPVSYKCMCDSKSYPVP